MSMIIFPFKYLYYYSSSFKRRRVSDWFIRLDGCSEQGCHQPKFMMFQCFLKFVHYV